MKHFLLLISLISSATVAQQVTQNDSIFKISDVDQKPEYEGGIENFYKFVAKNFRVPEEDVEGKIIIAFTIEKDGTLTNFKLIQDIGFGTGAEMLDLIKKSPRWNPGKKDGQTVRVLYSVPITIRAGK